MEKQLSDFIESVVESKLYEKGYLMSDITITDCDGLSYVSGWCTVKPFDSEEDYKAVDFVLDFDGSFLIDTNATPTDNDVFGIMEDFNEFIGQYTGKEFE